MVNLANTATILRIPILFLIIGLLYSLRPYSATTSLFTFVFGAWTDWLEAHLSKRRKVRSPLRQYLDAVIDKIFMISTFVTMLFLKIVPQWTVFLIIMIVLREFLITAFRSVAAAKKIAISPESAGTFKTAIQMTSTITLLAWFSAISDFPQYFDNSHLDYFRKTGVFLFCIFSFLTAFSGVKYILNYRSVLSDL
ncbi:CDP-alcohol phosphatidyltransferase family protein [Trichomonas vaginalis G3]|uniref:CDP-alcohol phosphatidyltransferase family protein n=1 Tax=Trichomonas vaginalis (strain ATCC PRA-98 / G3) TaxID=412133 RepID=A2DRK0_TRIV3|nr:cardiolipin synthase protein [Trichomonas vaginalis G3]EAY16963.1 CDP-alcohol phosphatidyltransferase family protein [Trichomonas vaginalis G3]KAI5508991.1 cardiolipin synthase protein [Trichomonas vaginalis G3]|eukprot:XP_001329186.1 CDP-alcohol phosphatidyltransferase family protein [Trichomonas vaginalis G3]